MPGEDPDDHEPGQNPRTARLSSWYLLAGAPIAVAYFVLPENAAKLVIWPVIGWSSVMAIIIGISLNHPSAPAAWYLLGGGVAALIVGDDLYSYRILVQHAVAPYPSYIDIAYLAMYPLLVGGLAVLVHHRSKGRDRTVLLDTAIITTGLGVVWWVAFLAPYYRNGDLEMLERVVSITYPIGDILILAIAVRLVVVGGHHTRAFWLLAAGLVGLFVSDAAYGFLALDEAYVEHSPVDIGWAIFYLGWGAAALHPSMASLSETVVNHREIGHGRLAVVGSAVLIPPIMLFAQDALGEVSDATPIAISSAVIFVLVLIRAVGIVRKATSERGETRFRALIDKSSDAILVIDGDARIRYHSYSAERIFGRGSAELEGSRLTELLREADERRLRLILSSHSPTTNFECRVRHGDGGWRDFEVIADDLRGTTEVDGIVLTMRDVTKRNQLNLELRRQALHDSLTGLPNRVLFTDRIDQAMRRVERRGRSVAVLFLDLDDFRVVNDSLGHAAGDELLIAVAARLLMSVRAGDSVARLGGDEFGFLLENEDLGDGAEATALRIQELLRAPFTVGDKQLQVSASIGIAEWLPRSHSPEDLLRDAEVAMYIAKRKGKNHFELFRPEMHDDATRRLEVAAELLGGMERGELAVYYQPIVEVSSGHIAGVEALVRWQHPQRGLLAANEFIPTAEDAGLIGSLDRWVLNQACKQSKVWMDAGICDGSFYVSVNISARHLQDRNVVRDVRDALGASGLDPEALMLEVTETALIEDLESATAMLANLKQLGVRIAVDDFGTGYSSLTHLVEFPLDVIKIDKSFVDRLLIGSEGEVMVRAVVDLAKTFGLNAVAEGVESSEQARALDNLDCRFAQGYLYSRPVPDSNMAELLVGQPLGACESTT